MDAFLKGGKAGASGDGAVAAAPAVPVAKPWVEKYRPKSMEEVAYQNEVVAVLKSCVQGNDMPHLLFYGPPGTGKTSTILAIARELFGPELLKSRVLELNASDERGISVVRDKIKNFAKMTSFETNKDYPCPPYKIVILDEADAMTADAQSALRRTMEQYSRITRFCLICNYISRIIEPLASRCAKFRFKPLSLDTLMARLTYIRNEEGVVCDDETLNRLVVLCDGDLRQAITFLQSAHRLKQGGAITLDDITEIAGVVPQKRVETLFSVCGRSSFEQMEAAIKDTLAEGYSANQIVMQAHDYIVSGAAGLNDLQTAIVAEKLAVIDKRLIDGADEYLQIMDLFCCVLNAMDASK